MIFKSSCVLLVFFLCWLNTGSIVISIGATASVRYREFFLCSSIWNNVLCSTVYIISTLGDNCPFSGQCYTLQQYADQPVVGSDIALEIQPGNHNLSTELSLSSLITHLNITSNNGTIVCVSQGSVQLDGVQNVHIKGVTFTDC